MVHGVPDGEPELRVEDAMICLYLHVCLWGNWCDDERMQVEEELCL